LRMCRRTWGRNHIYSVPIRPGGLCSTQPT
jgi:hypothetical protein